MLGNVSAKEFRKSIIEGRQESEGLLCEPAPKNEGLEQRKNETEEVRKTRRSELI